MTHALPPDDPGATWLHRKVHDRPTIHRGGKTYAHGPDAPDDDPGELRFPDDDNTLKEIFGEDILAVAEAQRWKVVIPAGTLMGISEQDARRIAAEYDGTVYRSTVTLYADGSEYLGPWEPA